jgi:hypothetical protein
VFLEMGLYRSRIELLVMFEVVQHSFERARVRIVMPPVFLAGNFRQLVMLNLTEVCLLFSFKEI